MDPHHPVWTTSSLREAIAHQQYGRVVRILRQAEGLTLAELGRRCGYSASRLSRLERDLAPLADVGILRRFATALNVSPTVFGLLPAEEESAGADEGLGTPSGPNVVPGDRGATEEDPVRRRELLAASAGLAGAATLGLPRNALADQCFDLDRVLYEPARTAPVSLDRLETAARRARDQFQAAHYDALTQALPALVATATATREHAPHGQTERANAILADVYLAANALLLKHNDDRLAGVTADRAVQAAAAGGDPLTLADARRAVAVVMRRTGQRAQAQRLLLAAAHELQPTGDPSDEHLSMYGNLLQIAAYTAAVDGDRHSARDYIAEAADTAQRLGADANHRWTAFGPSNVTLYQVSIAQVLGDNGTAIEHAQRLRGVKLPTREREGRLGVDVARAYHQWGKPDACYRVLRRVERIAPDEVRHRPPVRRMVQDLLRADRRGSLPGLRAFAGRVGVRA
ncbi:helix-turn-helix domain-containing protein [Actinomadura rupiterrae]|uniref:helix-turn-helix domain-containing protein n=1 Tax=Actinomadura rupiterrae TaxID=559627 RepID=UPI0020A2FEBD|nr:helix-turn-helix transcriptional regulator [Actinomadura rupiterrae]MCP2339148.1 transcriptional regulator with XRE-family HTH domain [Actinomadura rupiterrae]